MAVSIDASTLNQGTSFSHTVGASANLLCVIVHLQGGSGQDVTAVSYNGVALTKGSGGHSGYSEGAHIWYLVNPPSGAHTVSVTTINTNTVACSAVSFNGAHATSPIGGSNDTSGNSFTLTVQGGSGLILTASTSNGGAASINDGETSLLGDTSFGNSCYGNEGYISHSGVNQSISRSSQTDMWLTALEIKAPDQGHGILLALV